MPIQAGTTFRPRYTNGRGPHHLSIVISDPVEYPGSVLVVNVTSLGPGDAAPCVLEKLDHPLITHTSRIAYEYVGETTGLTTVDKLTQAIKQGRIELSPPVSEPILKRIREGAMASKDLAPRFQELLRLQGCIG